MMIKMDKIKQWVKEKGNKNEEKQDPFLQYYIDEVKLVQSISTFDTQ